MATPYSLKNVCLSEDAVVLCRLTRGTCGVGGALVTGSAGPSRASPTFVLFSRDLIFLAYSSDNSKPIQRRPSFFATASVVPLPPNGSSTNSAGFEQQRMIRPSNCSGIWQP